MSTVSILKEVRQERARQDAKFPDQRLPFGTGWDIHRAVILEKARLVNDEGEATWASVLEEEFYEAMIAEPGSALRDELIQTAAVCVRIIENLDANGLREGER